MKTTNTGTSNLFGIALRSLTAGAWVTARFALEGMVARELGSAVDYLPVLSSFEGSAKLGAEYARVLSDRIVRWNAAVDARAARAA